MSQNGGDDFLDSIFKDIPLPSVKYADDGHKPKASFHEHTHEEHEEELEIANVHHHHHEEPEIELEEDIHSHHHHEEEHEHHHSDEESVEEHHLSKSPEMEEHLVEIDNDGVPHHKHTHSGHQHHTDEHEESEHEEIVDEDNFFDRPIHTLAFENGIEETTDDDENKSSELSSPVVPNKNADHDRLPEELKKHQIGQSIQQYAGDVESEPETFHTESVTDLRQKDVEDDDEHSHSSDDETLHGSHEDDTDEDCEAVKAVQYQFDSKDVYKVKRTHKKKDEFQQELNEYIRRRSDNEENAKEVRAAVEQFDKEQQEAATRPYSSQVANYGADDRTEDIRIGHGAAPVEPKRRTSVKRKEQQVAKEKEDNGREVTVHTSLHDTVGRYSTFEPDRQETIRNEIGNLLNIRDLMGHFEKGGAEKAPRPWTRRTVQESTFVPLFTPDDIKRMSIDDLTHSIKEDHHEHVHHPPAAP
jgi:hypothetical protein